jgi:uncharacterized protein (TIGR02145 family)
MNSGRVQSVAWIILATSVMAWPSATGAQGGPSEPPTTNPLPKVQEAEEAGTVVDGDGNVYRTVKIGDQWWMAENLRVTRDPDGNPIESRVYNDDESLLGVYGRMYSWDVAMNGSDVPGARGIAPDGWHIPSREDWDALFRSLGGDRVAGGMLKEMGTEHWDAPNAGASDAAGFAGVPGGGFSGRIFEGLGVGGHYWSSTGEGAEAGGPTLHRDYAEVLRLMIPKTFSLSVRCVMDLPDQES